MLRIGFVIALGLLSGCTVKGPNTHQSLFDTQTFFRAQIHKLQQGRYGLVKEMFVAEKHDSLFLDSINWEAELAVFTSIDLTKPAYKGRFQVDSVVTDNEIVVHYQRLDKSTDLEHVWIRKQGNEIRELKFEYGAENELYASSKRLIYYPETGFEISGNQAVRLSESFAFKARCTFVKPISNQ